MVNMEFLKREFVTEEEVDQYYCEYAKTIGFGVCKNTKRFNKYGMLIGDSGYAANTIFNLKST